MASEIKTLWPEDVTRVDVLTPEAILAKQAADLSRLTQGILRGEVVTYQHEESVDPEAEGTPQQVVRLDVLAPLLSNTRRTVVTLTHEVDLPYPCWFDNERQLASTDVELMNALSRVLGSKQTIGLIQSLLARSNEAAQPPARAG